MVRALRGLAAPADGAVCAYARRLRRRAAVAAMWTGDNNATGVLASISDVHLARLSGEASSARRPRFIAAPRPNFSCAATTGLLGALCRNHAASTITITTMALRSGLYRHHPPVLRLATVAAFLTRPRGSHRTACPFRPLVLNFQADRNTSTWTTVYGGDGLLAAPVQRRRAAARSYLPDGRWYDFGRPQQ